MTHEIQPSNNMETTAEEIDSLGWDPIWQYILNPLTKNTLKEAEILGYLASEIEQAYADVPRALVPAMINNLARVKTKILPNYGIIDAVLDQTGKAVEKFFSPKHQIRRFGLSVGSALVGCNTLYTEQPMPQNTPVSVEAIPVTPDIESGPDTDPTSSCSLHADFIAVCDLPQSSMAKLNGEEQLQVFHTEGAEIPNYYVSTRDLQLAVEHSNNSIFTIPPELLEAFYLTGNFKSLQILPENWSLIEVENTPNLAAVYSDESTGITYSMYTGDNNRLILRTTNSFVSNQDTIEAEFEISNNTISFLDSTTFQHTSELETKFNGTLMPEVETRTNPDGTIDIMQNDGNSFLTIDSMLVLQEMGNNNHLIIRISDNGIVLDLLLQRQELEGGLLRLVGNMYIFNPDGYIKFPIITDGVVYPQQTSNEHNSIITISNRNLQVPTNLATPETGAMPTLTPEPLLEGGSTITEALTDTLSSGGVLTETVTAIPPATEQVTTTVTATAEPGDGNEEQVEGEETVYSSNTTKFLAETLSNPDIKTHKETVTIHGHDIPVKIQTELDWEQEKVDAMFDIVGIFANVIDYSNGLTVYGEQRSNQGLYNPINVDLNEVAGINYVILETSEETWNKLGPLATFAWCGENCDVSDSKTIDGYKSIYVMYYDSHSHELTIATNSSDEGYMYGIIVSSLSFLDINNVLTHATNNPNPGFQLTYNQIGNTSLTYGIKAEDGLGPDFYTGEVLKAIETVGFLDLD